MSPVLVIIAVAAVVGLMIFELIRSGKQHKTIGDVLANKENDGSAPMGSQATSSAPLVGGADTRVVLTDINIGFWRMVVLTFQWTCAGIIVCGAFWMVWFILHQAMQ